MDFKRQLLQKSSILAEDIRMDEPMRDYTTFRTGGPAKYFITPRTKEEVADVIACCREHTLAYVVLGRGSNVLVSDKGFDGAVICLSKHFTKYRIEENRVYAQAGASLMQIARDCAARGLQGLAFAGGIPGSLGGGICMNCGAYDGEIANVLTGATILNPKDGRICYYQKEELELGYRHSKVLEEGLLVLEAQLGLKWPDDREKAAKEEMKQLEEYNRLRREKQPMDYPSAGSTFRRPQGAFAGKLIMEAGLAGFSVGDAQVSPKHCGFVINKGHATSSEIFELCQIVKKKVYDHSGYSLELEVQLLGEFTDEHH